MKRSLSTIGADFPKLDGLYLDWACMSVRPKPVIDAITQYYTSYPACGGRSNHALAQKVDSLVQQSRKKISDFFDAKGYVLVFTKNTTEAIHLVRSNLSALAIKSVIISSKEHNSNLIPWLSEGIKPSVVSLKQELFDIDAYTQLVKLHTGSLVSVVGCSNLDGTCTPLADICRIAKKHSCYTLIDGCQLALHHPVSLRDLSCDFFAFSGHKMLGPTGIGGLFIKESLFSRLSPVIVGGETIANSTYDSCVFQKDHHLFEAGLQHYDGIIGLGSACDFIESFGKKALVEHELRLNTYVTEQLRDIVQIIGPKDPALRSGIFTFIPPMNVHECSLLLSSMHSIYVRSGMHCVNSYYNARGLSGAVRASFGPTTTMEDVKRFVESLKQVIAFSR
jgi:cysteine desulfurase / selenocysteine lyase